MYLRPANPLLLLLAAGLWLFATLAQAVAPIEAQLSRTPVALNESFTLTYHTTAEPDGPPEWRALEEHFEILSQQQSHSTQVLNGRATTTVQWRLTLLARQAGRFTIPPIPFGSRSSEAVTLVVEPAATSAQADGSPEDLFLRLELEESGPLYVQQQALLTVRLYRAVNIGNASLTNPEQEAITFVKLGDDEQFETRIDGRVYAVTERRYALFPQRSGTLTIPPVRFQGEVYDPRHNHLNRFFIDPFGGRGSGRVVRLHSDPLELEVLPIPAAAAAGASWLPSSNLQLVDDWAGGQEPQFQVGEPVTRTLLLLADGLTAAQLPPLPLAGVEGVRAYPDQPVLENRASAAGVTGLRREQVALMPTQPGSFTLPAIEVPWWNSETGGIEVARLEARTFSVQPGPEAVAPGSVAPSPADPAAEPSGDLGVPADQRLDPGWWRWLALLFASGWLATLLLWGGSYYRARRAERAGGLRASWRSAPSHRAIQRACQRNAPEQASEALLAWAAAHWPDHPPRSLGALAARTDAATAEQLQQLDRSRYAPGAEGWKGQPLWEAWQAWRRQAAHSAPEQEQSAVPLAPLC